MTMALDDDSPLGLFVAERNRARLFDFLHTSYVVSTNAPALDIDHDFICALNRHATEYLSRQTGRYRRHTNMTVGSYEPPHWSMVLDEMGGFIELLHLNWKKFSPAQSAAYALWAVNYVHPFSAGNGRTARALCYYILCRKMGQWLPGRGGLLEMMRTRDRPECVEILTRMHATRRHTALVTDLAEMSTFIERLLAEQISEAQRAGNAAHVHIRLSCRA